MGWRLAIAIALVPACLPAKAHATNPLGVSAGTTIVAYADLDIAATRGERSWLDGGFGKGRTSGARDGGWRAEPYLPTAGFVLQPHLGWALTATVSAIAQQGQEHPIDLSEGFLTYRPFPIGGVRFSARGGMFWPPVSLEHSGPEWAVTNTITPSAINSWVGEEVKITGGEAAAIAMVRGSRITLAAALFGYNQTAGTLLAFRGWALHDEQATAFGHQSLPPLNAFMRNVQAADDRPVIQFDNRPGYYVKLGWAPPGPLEFSYLHYDNRADPKLVDRDRQWGWRTRFDTLGVIVDVDPATRLTAQAMTGMTLMGFPVAGKLWVDMRYRSAFLLATRKVATGSISTRVEGFDTHNRGSRLGIEDDEHGWAATVAAKLPLAPFAILMAEGQRIDSHRDARTRLGLDPHQRQTIVRLSLRLRATR